MAGRQITVVGECVADAFVERDGARAGELALRVLPGGGPANTAVALARLGTPTRFVGRISADPFGELLRGHLSGSGVDLAGTVAAAEPSTLALAALDGDGHAKYSFHAEGTADWQWTPEELATARDDGSACLHTGSLALVRDPGGPRIEDLLTEARPYATVSVDPNVRTLLVAPETYRQRLGRWCELADLLRLSEDDLHVLLPGVTPEDACDHWHAAGVRLVVVTLAERGALASLDGRRVRVAAPVTPVVDTVGAGDSFTAGLLHSLAVQGHLGGRLDSLTPDDLERACRFATRVAARTVAVPGANPPWAEDL
ncbi:carbohydrate kinase [Kitasatospora sp. NA04385]|uniref:carbohydrate kinase family protein n=1 Tax=Kitasatospora sp. NA04385 TaxID=2742135 RepID=UPI0015917E92|nr:carbohydrate kinase [Kitasatospora sp. NA04385]QKW23229.1 carbohydrate kinase [Kitasatospora sp. NA04385]